MSVQQMLSEFVAPWGLTALAEETAAGGVRLGLWESELGPLFKREIWFPSTMEPEDFFEALERICDETASDCGRYENEIDARSYVAMREAA